MCKNAMILSVLQDAYKLKVAGCIDSHGFVICIVLAIPINPNMLSKVY